MTAYTYYQSIGWNKINATAEQQLLIGLYNELNNTWSNDLWLQGANKNKLYHLLSKVTFNLILDKYINTNLQPSSMTVHIDFYADLPAMIKGGYKVYSKDDIQDNLLGQITTDITSSSKHIDIEIAPNLEQNKIYIPPGTFYTHIYTIATQAEDNNKIKAYINNTEKYSFLKYDYDTTIGHDDKAVVTYKYYYPNSSYISKIITEPQYYNLEDGIKSNLEPAPYGYENRSERVTGENIYLVKRVQEENLEITFITNDDNITIDGQKFSYAEGYKINAWIINGKNYGNANPLKLEELTPELITGKNQDEEYYCEVKADVTPITYSIAIPILNTTYTFTIDNKPKWPSLPVLPRGLESSKWKSNNNETTYTPGDDMPLQSMVAYPVIQGAISFKIGEEKRNLSYNPLGYYSLEPLTQGDRTIYAYTTDINEKGVPIGPVYSIYEIIDTTTFNSRFTQEQKLYPLTHEVIKGNPLAVQKKNTNEWSTEIMEGYLYQKTKEGVWKRVN